MPDLPTHELTRDQVQRSMVFLADDLSFAPTTIPDIRKGLQRAVERNLQPGDTAAIIRTSSGNSSLEQFTSDKRVLIESVGKIRWRPEGRGTGGAGYDSLKRSAMVLQYVISALRDLPGRKAIFFISQSLPIGVYSNNQNLASLIGGLVDRSLRAGVVIYTIDPTPLSNLAPDASYDAMSGVTAGARPVFPGQAGAAQVSAQVRMYMQQGLALLEFNRTGLRLLAEGTGGQIAEDTDMPNARRKVFRLETRPAAAVPHGQGERDSRRTACTLLCGVYRPVG
jgi:VWFA-related protein